MLRRFFKHHYTCKIRVNGLWSATLREKNYPGTGHLAARCMHEHFHPITMLKS